MPFNFALGIPIVVAVTLGSGFVANEWSHGGLSEAMGLGHHHALDFGGYHCVPHDDPEQGEMHVAHMHESGSMMPHEDCPGGATMHQDMGNMNGMPDHTAQGGMGMMP